MTVNVQKNLEKIKKNPVKIEAGEDNRSDKLHESRFIGGHICQNSEIWLKARESVGIAGLEPISRYDSDGIGLNGNINSHIWALLHNPGAKEISITRFSPEALKAARTSNDKDAESCKKQFGSVDEIRHALASMRTAVHMIYPWNMSIVTLEYFLNSIHFGARDLASTGDRVNFVTEFIDEVLLFNAEAWDDNMPFLSASGIGQKWTRDFAVKAPGPSKTPQKSKDQKSPNSQQKFQNKDSQNKDFHSKDFQNRDRKIFPGFLCRRFNFKICPSQNDDVCNAPWNSSLKLKHGCGFQKPDKSFCLEKHPLIEHK